MLQRLNHKRNEEVEDTGRNAEQQQSPTYEGFEGMNYEQPRQPYRERVAKSDRKRSGTEPGSVDENDTSPE